MNTAIFPAQGWLAWRDKAFAKFILSLFVAASLLVPAAAAYAATPFLSVSNMSGDTVTFSVTNANPYSTITLYRKQNSSLWTVITNLGTTDANGSFTQQMSLGSDGSGNPVDQYVVVGGMQSNTASTYPYGGGGCYGSNCTTGNLTLSQTSIAMNVGQSSVVMVNFPVSGYNNNFYISNNSNSSVATASVSGSQITIYGAASGSTTVSVCANSNNQCASLYVTVSGNNNGTIYFNPSSVSLSAGQNTFVTVLNNNSNSTSYYISNNSNTAAISASLTGTSLYVNALSAGSSIITVCQSGYASSCGTLYVTVVGTVSGNSNYTVSVKDNFFSPATITIPQGSAITWSNQGSMNHTVTFDTLYGDSGTLYPGSSYTQTFNSSGSFTYHCRFHSGMTGTVIVTGSSGSSGNIWFSPSNPSLSVGQNLAVSIYSSAYYNNSAYYISSNSNSYVANATVSGNVLSIYANQYGSTTISVCQNSYNACANVYVTVNSYGSTSGGGLRYPGGGNVLGANSYANGQLISEGSTIYIVYKNLKTPFANSQAFRGLGYTFSDALQVGNSGLANSGYTVTSSNVQHPWGSWIKSGNTIYFVHEFGLIPLPDWNTFLGNGGQSNVVVPANRYDFRLPILNAMTYADPRLQ